MYLSCSNFDLNLQLFVQLNILWSSFITSLVSIKNRKMVAESWSARFTHHLLKHWLIIMEWILIVEHTNCWNGKADAVEFYVDSNQHHDQECSSLNDTFARTWNLSMIFRPLMICLWCMPIMCWHIESAPRKSSPLQVSKVGTSLEPHSLARMLVNFQGIFPIRCSVEWMKWAIYV